MIAPLLRQHVRRRQRTTLRLRGRRRASRVHRLAAASGPGVHSAPLWRGPQASWRMQQPARPRRLRARSRGQRARLGVLRGLGGLVVALGRRPVAVLAALAGAALLCAGALLLPGRLFVVRPAFPAPSEADLEMYQLLVGEREASEAAELPGPAVLRSLATTAYTVRAGDSVSLIAQRFRLNIDTVVSWNDIREARSLAPGTVLSLPNADGLKYRVRRGDTLEGIAKRNRLELNTLLDFNQLASEVIVPGQVLFLPGARLPSNEIARIIGSLFVWPVRGRISSWFGSRPDPFTGIARPHEGLDIKANTGTPVVAAMAGRARTGWNSTYGWYVILTHSGYQTLYGHLSRLSVQQGQQVSQGQKIGEVGNTGYSTGSHLHFGIYQNGEPIDPWKFLK